VSFVVDEVALGQIFLQLLRFPLPILIPPNYALIRSSIPERGKFATNNNRECDRGVKLTTHLNPVPRLGMVELHLQSPIRHNGIIKHREKFILPITGTYT
jgi:hypothetical protein